jgi:hypothetical protein
MYVQQAPVPVQASLVSPEILASKIIQLNAGGIAFNTVKIINNVSKALKFVVFICLLRLSINLIPVYSILINERPIKPIIKGKNILRLPGKNEVIFKFKNEYTKTSKIDNINNKDPI